MQSLLLDLRGSEQMSENVDSIGSIRSQGDSDVFCSATEVELDFLRVDRFGSIRVQGEHGCVLDTNIVIFQDLVHSIKLRTSGGADPGTSESFCILCTHRLVRNAVEGQYFRYRR